MELNCSQSLFDLPEGLSIEQTTGELEFPPSSVENQHLVSQRIAQVFLEQFNDSIATYIQAKKEGRYKKVADIFGQQCVMDDAKNAMFESLIWAFELRSFDRISFASCCLQAGDDHYGDPEEIKFFLSRHMKEELLEMVEFIRASTPAGKAKRIVEKLSEYITCPAIKEGAEKEVFA